MQYDKLLWRMAMWIRRPPIKKQLMMWAVIAGFGLILAGMENTVCGPTPLQWNGTRTRFNLAL